MKSACKLQECAKGGGGGREGERDMPLIKLIYAKYNSNKQCSHVHAAAQRAKFALPQKVKQPPTTAKINGTFIIRPVGPSASNNLAAVFIYCTHTHTSAYWR